MKTKHTPGPWTPGWYNATDTFKQRIAEERQCAIVQDTDPINGKGMLIAICGDLKDEQSRADANLIATAPEMLEVLIRVNHTLMLHGKVQENTPLHELLQSTIAKATGEKEAAL